MKNHFILKTAIVASVCVGSLFSACSKSDVQQTGNKVLLTSGKWQLISATSSVNGAAGVQIQNAPAIISFTSNNRYRIYGTDGGVVHDVAYTFDDKNTISFDGNTFDMTTINQSNLTLMNHHADSITVDTYNYTRML